MLKRYEKFHVLNELARNLDNIVYGENYLHIKKETLFKILEDILEGITIPDLEEQEEKGKE